MTKHALELLIEAADKAIMQEDFDRLLEIYAEDGILVIKPGKNAAGKTEIRKAMEAIAAHFDHTLRVRQAGMKVLEAGDTALVLAKTLVSAANLPAIERNATYVFTKDSKGEWRCKIDNSYGHELLLQNNLLE
ncbi:YybH family protein [Gloeobacter morelensis]|uniref:SgcJ/EcaC family oxidoreductase n=1 Tax=Gloeobacter morelensis MG652769 TaxID=2781736 RepID=A0ABY3PHI3_9CYAN|nr:SgcJ/EcaC family oxidoreductase [Gloeobacter morelensis]UFP93136.1 SgcJ/EcaC family oxidoreductase [Gloeobacter morelensis MG652769]